MKNEKFDIFEAIGRVIGFVHIIPFSIIGVAMIIFGASMIDPILRAVKFTEGNAIGGGLIGAALILGGTGIQICKMIRK